MAAYPRKQTFVTFLLCTMAVLGVGYYVYGDSLFFWTAKKTSYGDSAKITPVLSEVLPANNDWKKQFLASADSQDSFKAPAVAKKVAAPTKLTVTDKLSREMMTKLAELNSAGLTSDANTVNAVMGQLAQDSLQNLPTPKTYSSSNIIITANSASAMKAYWNTLSYVLNTFSPKTNELEIAATAMNQGQTSALAKIDPIIVSYRTMLKQLLETPVPSNIAGYHLDLVNGLSVSLYAAQSLRHIDSDPMQALAAMGLEQSALGDIGNAFVNIQHEYSL